MFAEFLGFLIILGFLYLWHLQKRPERYPPGPFRWPFLGNLGQVGMEAHKSIMKMRSKYGDIISIDMGLRRAVFLNEYSIIKEAFSSQDCDARVEIHLFADPETGLFKGTTFNSGKVWDEQRRFAFSYFQSILRNTKAMENLILREVQELIDELSTLSGKAVTTNTQFNVATINAMWSVITGVRYSLTDPVFMNLTNYVTCMAKEAVTLGLYIFYYPIIKMFPVLSGFKKSKDRYSEMHQFMKNIMKAHKASYKEGTQPDFVDAYLLKISQTTDPKSSFYGKFGETQLCQSLVDFFLAGAETTAITIKWLIFLMAHHPNVQDNIITMIKKKIDKGRLPTLDDRPSLPYIEATINEALRYSSIFPFALFHEATVDTEIRSYKIPKGTMVIPNLYAVHHDPEVWADPQNFRPQRFLSSDESEVIRHSNFSPFSVGRRICPGESFARNQLFLFITGLFQNFRVEFNPNIPNPPLKDYVGSLLYPIEHQVVFHKLLS